MERAVASLPSRPTICWLNFTGYAFGVGLSDNLRTRNRNIMSAFLHREEMWLGRAILTEAIEEAK